MNEKWFNLSVAEIENELKTNAASGLSLKAARSRASARKKDEPFFTVKKRRLDKLILELFSDIFLVLLALLAIFSLFFEGDAVIGSAILILILVNLVWSFFIYYRDRRSLESMSDFFSPTARVIRGGKLYIADYRDVVEGDVILIEKGDILGCDARLIHSDSLSVKMRIDKKTEKLIEKYASGAVRPDEIYAENMVNMVHAGSVIVSGSGRAIVTTVGKYTYLGAMTGGIAEIPSKEIPEGLVRLKKECSKLGMLFLLLTLPFCISSFIFGSFPGGNVSLSEAVLAALAIGATAMLSRASNLFCGFFVRYIRKTAVSKDPCIVRSLQSFDGLADVDYLFLLDGSVATDGILHFEALATADGETQSLERMGKSATALCELIGIYSYAKSSSLATGIGANGDIDVGVSEFITKSALDIDAIKIRYEIQSYLSGVDKTARDSVIYSDKGTRKEINVCFSGDVIDFCRYATVAGTPKLLSSDGRENLRRSFAQYVANGRKPIIFTLVANGERCFVGMLILHEGADEKLADAIADIRKSGVRIISFSNCPDRKNAPEIPDLLRRGNRAFAEDFARKGLSPDYSFGSYDEYCGFDAEDIAIIAEHAKAEGKGLMICGFTDFGEEAIRHSDIFVSCSPIRTGVFGHFDEEIRSLEVPGEQNSASCLQTVKAEADLLLMRPSGNKGGLSPLAIAVSSCRIAYRNLTNFVKYLTFASLMRLVAIAFPMLLGQMTADAVHLLILGFVVDMAAMVMFMRDNRRVGNQKKNVKTQFLSLSGKTLLKQNLPLAVSAILGGVLILILPNLIDLVNVFGNYIYQAEYTFCSLILLQLALFLCVYLRDILSKTQYKKLFSSKVFLIEASAITLFVLLCFLTPIGNLFGLVSNPPMYLIISFLPALSFLVCFYAMSFPRKNKADKLVTGEKAERKENKQK